MRPGAKSTLGIPRRGARCLSRFASGGVRSPAVSRYNALLKAGLGLVAIAVIVASPPGWSPSAAADRSALEREEDQARAPAPIEDVADGEGEEPEGRSLGEIARGVVDAVRGTIESWHAELSKQMSAGAAWGVLASPAGLLALLFFIRRWQRRPRRPKKAKKPAEGKPAKAAAPAPRKTTAPAPATPLELSKTRLVLLAPDAGALSLFETLLGLGYEEDSFTALTFTAHAYCDAATWAAAVTDGRPQRLRDLRRYWVRQTILTRVASWVREHPLVAGKLALQTPGTLADAAVDDLALTQPDGLGADLAAEQQHVLDLARRVLAEAYACDDNPFALARLTHSGVKGVLPASALRGPAGSFGVALLLGGINAHERLRAAEIPAVALDEFCDAVDEHRQLVNAPVPAEGAAVHALTALGGGNLPGIGTLMASVAGAAFSTSAVVLRISKLAGDLGGDVGAAVSRVGQLGMAALANPSTGDGKVLEQNIKDVLGRPLLTDEEKRSAELGRAFERRAAKDPLWPGKGKEQELERPELALHGLYHDLVARAGQQTAAAEVRLFEIMGALAHAGNDGQNLAIAHRRFGYTLIGMGMPLLRGASTEMLSAAREALAACEPSA